MPPTRPSFPDPAARDYVLGTDDVEVQRLGLQHRVWRGEMLEGWRIAGLAPGMRAVDVGAGPGYATLELAEAVGPDGRVLALERSPKFTGVLRSEIQRRGLANVDVREVDLLADDALDGEAGTFDMAWCRWIACFLPELEAYGRVLARLVRPGGRLVTHEYAAYRTWQCLPPWPRHEAFIEEVLAGWRAADGDPDVAGLLTAVLRDAGFDVVSMRPLVFVTRPGDAVWPWPASFIRSHPHRLSELGRVTEDWARELVASFDAYEAEPGVRMITPMVLEIVAERRAD